MEKCSVMHTCEKRKPRVNELGRKALKFSVKEKDLGVTMHKGAKPY